MSVVKKSISLPEETLTQIEALRKLWMHCDHVSLSAMIAECVSDAYWYACSVNNSYSKDFLGTNSKEED